MFNCWNLRKAKRHNNRLHVAHDSCHLFSGPTFGSRWPPLVPVGPRVSIGSHWPPLAPISSHWPPLAPVCNHGAPSLKCVFKHDATSTRSMPTMNTMTNKPKQTTYRQDVKNTHAYKRNIFNVCMPFNLRRHPCRSTQAALSAESGLRLCPFAARAL